MIFRSRLCLFIIIFIHSMRELRGRGGGITLSVRLCVCADSSLVCNFFLVLILAFFKACNNVSRTFVAPIRRRPLTSKSKLFRFFYLFSCPTRARNLCLLKHWHTIFGTRVYHYKMMCRVYSLSWYDIDLCPQGQINRILTWLPVRG